jgi:alpha-maltose-1-phosphate synthase
VLIAATVERERVHVIHNGIDPTEYRPVEGRDALIRYGIDPERPYLLCVGRITSRRGSCI